MAALIDARLGKVRAGVDVDHLVVRLKLHGATVLNWRLRRDPEFVEGAARDRAGMVDRVWIEKIELETTEAGADASAAGPVAELAAEMRRSIAGSGIFREDAERLMDELAKALPPEARHVFGNSEAEHHEILAALSTEGCEAVLAHLYEGAGGKGEG